MFQKRFTYVWCSILGASVLFLGVPYLSALTEKGQRTRLYDSITGLREEWSHSHHGSLSRPPPPASSGGRLLRWIRAVGKSLAAIPMLGYKIPYIELNIGQSMFAFAST